jgi:methyl-accepting chemotaxis protein
MEHSKQDNSLNDEFFPKPEASSTAASGITAQTNANIYSSLNETVTILKTAVEEILMSVDQSAESALTTDKAVLDTTVTVEELKQTAQIASVKAEQVSTIAHSNMYVSEQGRQATHHTVDCIEELQQKIIRVADKIKHLAQKNVHIGDTITMLTELTQQLNILAVNGAIEAAKSGSSGIGFAVVAKEMKLLSVESRDRTAQVQEILYEINDGIQFTLSLMVEVSNAAKQVLEQSNNATASIETLAQSLAESASAAAIIAATSNEQVAGMEHVSKSMNEIKAVSQQSRLGLERLERAAHEVNEISERLRSFVQNSSATQ